MKQKKASQAKYRLRDEKGRFVTKVFNETIVRALAAQKGVDSFAGEGQKKRQVPVKKVAKEANITPRELFLFYKTNEDTFLDMIHTGSLTGLSKNSDQIEKDLTKYKGTVILNGKEVNASEAKLHLVKFKQMLANSVNVVDFTIKPTVYFDGRIELNIPDASDLEEKLVEYFGAEDIDEVDREFTGGEITEALEYILEHDYGFDDDEIIIYAS
jgi:hypothetical protein